MPLDHQSCLRTITGCLWTIRVASKPWTEKHSGRLGVAVGSPPFSIKIHSGSMSKIFGRLNLPSFQKSILRNEYLLIVLLLHSLQSNSLPPLPLHTHRKRHADNTQELDTNFRHILLNRYDNQLKTTGIINAYDHQ